MFQAGSENRSNRRCGPARSAGPREGFLNRAEAAQGSGRRRRRLPPPAWLAAQVVLGCSVGRCPPEFPPPSVGARWAPPEITAAGVWAGKPSLCSLSACSLKAPIPMSTTRVNLGGLGLAPFVSAALVCRRRARPACGDDETIRHASVRDGDAGAGGRGHGARHPRDDLKGDAGSAKGESLFSAPPEDERIASFEAGHVLPGGPARPTALRSRSDASSPCPAFCLHRSTQLRALRRGEPAAPIGRKGPSELGAGAPARGR